MSVYSNSNPLRYTVITFNEELDVSFTLKGAGGGGGGHPDDITKDYKGGDGSAGSEVTGSVRVKAGDTWTVFVGGGGRRGLSWYLGGDGGLGGPAKAGYNGGAGGRMGAIGRSSGGGGGGGASVLSINGIDKAIASGGGGGGGEGRFSSGNDGTSHASGTSTYGEQGSSSNTDDGGGGGGGGGGTIGGRGGSFGSSDRGGAGGHRGSSSVAITGVTAISVGFGGAGGSGGSGDFTNNTSGADGSFVINSVTLPTSRYTGIYTKDAGTWKQPVPSVKYNGAWTQIQEGYVKNNDKWVRVYPPKVSVEINDYGVNEFGFGSPVQWNETINLVQPDTPPTPPDTTPDSFVIQSQFGKRRDTDVISGPITITGLSTSVSITATNGITVDVGNTGTYSSSSTISNGQSFKAKVRSSASYGTEKTGTVTVGDYATTWLVTTENEPVTPPDDPPPTPPDTTPNAFSFVSQNDLPLNSLRTSNTVTITGINVPVTATPSQGLSLSKNSGAYTTAPTTVVSGDTITLQTTSSTSYGRSATFELAVGQYSATWSLSTVGGVAPTAVNTSWQGAFNSINRTIHLPLTVNSVTSSPITAVTIVTQPKFGTVTISGTTAIYTPNTNASTPSSLSDGQSQTYVDYWTDLFPNGIKSTILAKSHWTTTGQGEGRFIPQIFAGADSFTWRVSNQYGESNIASCVLTFSAPSTAPLDNDPPVVVSTSPTGNRISTSTGISIEYSDQVYPGTGSITVTGSDTSSFSITNNAAVPSGRIVNFQPGKLKSSTTYTVTVPSGYAKDIAGNPSGSTSWSFTTADEEGPYVTNVAYPGNGLIRITWNEPVRIGNGFIEVIGPYYANGDIESISHTMTMGASANETVVEHSIRRDYRNGVYGSDYNRYYWGNRNYHVQIFSGAVEDYSGNPNEWSDHGFYSDYLAQPSPPVTTVPVVVAPVVVTPVIVNPLELGGLGTTFYSGVTNIDFSALAAAIDLGQITVVRVDSAAANLSMTGGTVSVSTDNNNIEVTVPNVSSIDVQSSTPTDIVGTVDAGAFGQLQLTVQPSTFGGVDVTCTSTGAGQVSTVPLNIDLTVETSSGFTATATCPVTVDLSNLIDQSMGSPAITYGGYSGSNSGWKFNTYDETDWYNGFQ